MNSGVMSFDIGGKGSAEFADFRREGLGIVLYSFSNGQISAHKQAFKNGNYS